MQSVFMFEQVNLGEQREQYIWNSFKFKMKFEFAVHLQYTSFKWNTLTHQKHIHQVSTFNHVIVHCTYVAPFDCCLSIEVEPEQEVPPSLKTLKLDPVRKGKNPPPHRSCR